MNRYRRWIAVAMLAGLLIPVAARVRAGQGQIKEIILFNGSNTSAAVDTVEQASPWFEVRGSNKVLLRFWSNAASSDTMYCDSLASMKILFSDSVCCTVTDLQGRSIPSMGDSIMFGPGLDSTSVGFRARQPPIIKPLDSDKTGSGLICTIYPITQENGLAEANQVFGKRFMRIRWTSQQRLTTAGYSSTQGIRTRGVNGLRVRAYVFWPND